MLFPTVMSPLTGSPLLGIAKVEHQEGWVGQLVALARAEPVDTPPPGLAAVLALLEQVGDPARRRHVSSTRCATRRAQRPPTPSSRAPSGRSAAATELRARGARLATHPQGGGGGEVHPVDPARGRSPAKVSTHVVWQPEVLCSSCR